jgi:hypothetical protein
LRFWSRILSLNAWNYVWKKWFYSIRLHINFLNFLILEKQWHKGAQQKWKIKGTRKVAPMHVMKAWRSRGIAPLILKHSNWGRWVVSFKAHLLYPNKNNSWYPLNRKLCEPQSQSGYSGEIKISCPCWNSNPQKSCPKSRHCRINQYNMKQ